jgi:hypothetical protein
MGDALAVHAAPAHGLGQQGKLAGSLLGDRRRRFFRPQLERVGEHPGQQLPRAGVGQLLDGDFARFIGIASEGGVDDDALAIAHHQQRRIVELQGIVGQLLEGGPQIAARLLVFPAKTAALPHIGPAIAAAGLPGAAFKAVVVRVARLVDAEQVTQVVEMLLGAGTFIEPVIFPESNEVFGGHGRVVACWGL